MFDALAGRYDLMNDILSMGQVRLWRKRVQRILQASPGDRVLDLAAGTGTSSVSFAAAGADVVACDFSLGMLKAGQARQVKSDPYGTKTRGRVAFTAGDALRLPFRDGAFDAVTISFGLRNVHGTRDALAEMRRVTRPGGRLVVCEFSEITFRAARYALPALPDRRPPRDRPARGAQPRGVRVPRRVDQRLARAAGACRRDPRGGLVISPVARPDPRRRGRPRRPQPLARVSSRSLS